MRSRRGIGHAQLTKLKQIQEKFGIIRKGDSVLDIGCHPGGWTQVAVEEVGESGKVIGVDLLVTSPVEGATVLVGDITHDSTIEEITREIAGGQLNCVISDISPRLTGRYDTDQAISWSSQRWHWMLHPISWSRGWLRYEGLQGAGIEGLVEAAKYEILVRWEVFPHCQQECFF